MHEEESLKGGVEAESQIDLLRYMQEIETGARFRIIIAVGMGKKWFYL